MRYVYVDGCRYEDYGPRPSVELTQSSRPVRPARTGWTARPYCDMCGPFRGRYLRRMADGEYRCHGCDVEV